MPPPPPAEMRAYTIALVDDHPVVLAGLERLLLRHGTYQVVVSATSGESLMEQMQRSGPVDLAIVDLRMPGMDGFAVIAWLKANYPATRSVALSFSDELQWVRRALHAGARGYLLKDMAPDAIHTALHQVVEHGQQSSDLILRGLLEPEGAHALLVSDVLHGIPPREQRFARYLLDPTDHTYLWIADAMGVTLSTVEGYFRYFSKRYGIHSRAELVLFLLRHGMAGERHT
ncbi:MAG: response regulator transcription factor [Flavobacteriales bacterium]|nr:response regulator transcription factor [Flavobacteriales bacterium]